MSGGLRRRGPSRAVRRGVAGAGAAAAALWVGMGFAQDQAGQRNAAPNPALTFDMRFGLEADDDGIGLTSDLGVAYLTRTRTQNLELSLRTAVELDDDGLGADAFLPVARLAYGFDNGRAALSLTGSYRLQEVEGLFFELDPEATDFDDVELIEDEGYLETVRAGAALALWQDEPVGLELGGDLSRRTYRDTANPDFDDSRSAGLRAALRLTPRPGLSFRLTASRDQSEDDGDLDSETRTTRLGGRVAWAATPATSVDLGLSQSHREETRNAFALVGGTQQLTGGRETVENDGLVFDGAVVQARPNGTRSLRFSRELTDEGSIFDLEAGRALSLARGGDLSLGLGAAHFEDGGTVLTGRLSYDRPLPRGARLTAGLSRSAGTNGNDRNVARTRANLTLSAPLTPVSRVSASVGVARLEVVDGDGADESAATLSVGYARDLTPDWSLSARYGLSASRGEGESTRSRNRFSLGIGRSFTFRP